MEHDWLHHPERPGEFISRDGRHWLVFNGDGWLLVAAEAVDGNHAVLDGPFDDPTDCGVSGTMADEGQDKSIDAVLARAKAGEKVQIHLAGALKRAAEE